MKCTEESRITEVRVVVNAPVDSLNFSVVLMRNHVNDSAVADVSNRRGAYRNGGCDF